MRHSEFREWIRAARGDSRQVYAREVDAAPADPLVFMPDGEALRLREAAKSGALICPVPACPSPGLTTRACEDRRDHFMHVDAPADENHNDSYRRIATRRLLDDWIADQNGVVEVREGKVDGVSIALLACLEDGSKVALCYVDTKLGADAWEKCNELHRSGGMAVAWIFALRKMYFSPPDPADPEAENRTDLIRDRPIYRRMRGNGSWPLLLNLEREEFANVIKPDGGPAKRLHLPSPSLDRVQHFVAHGLASCRLCPYGIATPAIPRGTLELSNENWRRP